MVESKPYDLAKAEELEVIFWIINNSNYDKLRKINGCENLADLLATPKDVVHIRNMARAYGVRPENLYEDSEPDIKALKKTHLKIMHQSKKLDVDGKPHVIMVYCGGHGA